MATSCIQPGSAERFAAALERLLDDDAARERMAAEGRRTALERYAWPRVGAQLESYYADLMAGKRPVWASARSSASS